MVEMLFAMFVLASAIVGAASMIVLGMGRNAATRMDTSASNIAETFLENIASAEPNATIPTPVTDCANAAWAINTAAGGSPLNPATGEIDFTQPKVAGYQADYTVCTANGLRVKYDVRWAIVQPSVANPSWSWARQVIVSAQQPLNLNRGRIFFTPPVTVRTVVGM